MEEKTVSEIVDLVRQLDDMLGAEDWFRDYDIEINKQFGYYRARLTITKEEGHD
jgi:hypothetical protein